MFLKIFKRMWRFKGQLDMNWTSILRLITWFSLSQRLKACEALPLMKLIIRWQGKNKSMAEGIKLKLWRILISFSAFKFWKKLLRCLYKPVERCRARLWTSEFQCSGVRTVPNKLFLNDLGLICEATHQDTVRRSKNLVTG